MSIIPAGFSGKGRSAETDNPQPMARGYRAFQGRGKGKRFWAKDTTNIPVIPINIPVFPYRGNNQGYYIMYVLPKGLCGN